MPKFARYVPAEISRDLNREHYPHFDGKVAALPAQGLAELRSINRAAFTSFHGGPEQIAWLWEVNRELTRRSVGPAWRDIPELSLSSIPEPTAKLAGSERLLSGKMRQTLLKRWIDLEWLRSTLGDTHMPRETGLLPIFKGDCEAAISAALRLTRMESTGGGKFGPAPAFKSLYALGLRECDSVVFSLVALVSRDARQRRANARKRLGKTVQPQLEALMERERHCLTQDQVDQRLRIAEALEIAAGSPTLAARLYGWMTGEAITRQSIHVAKQKMAEQCGFGTRAWRTP